MKAIMFGILVAVIALAWCGAAQAGTILLLSNTGWDGPTPAASYLIGRTDPDQQFVNWVANTLGHTVVRKYVSTATSKAQIEGWVAAAGADLIIIGPRQASANYTDKTINQIKTPMICMRKHCVRNDRLAWIDTTNLTADNIALTSMSIIDANHPWMCGVTSGVFYDYTNDGYGDTQWLNVTGNTDTNMLGNGTIIARGSGQAWDNCAEIVEWASGVAGYAGSTGGIFGERRALFMGTNWSRVNGTIDISDFTHDYTANAKLALANVIQNMLIPEPATLSLLVLGGLLALRRRR